MNKDKLERIWCELGVDCECVAVDKSPQFEIYHFNLYHIQDLKNVAKNLKFLTAFLHINAILTDTDKGHFAVRVEKKTKSLANFEDKYIQKHLSAVQPNSMLVGITDDNKPYTISLDDIPHILIAGTTGSGKSVLLHNMICSLLTTTKNDLDLLLIDTKRVEFMQYKNCNNLITAPITTAVDSVKALRVVCDMIDKRYKKLEELGIRKAGNRFGKVVVFIDEFADLIQDCAVVEKYIIKISQLGRACNIHLVVATQRPTVNVITGLIKANIGCRIGLQVTNERESRIIIDQKGAETLIGKGDLMLKVPNLAKPVHLQCPFIDDETIKKIVEGEQ